jgi:ribA/ribD-fused uncharacterized protein
VIRNFSYHSVEQFYQLEKARSAGDEASAKLILESDTPLQCKLIGDRVKSPTWDQMKVNVMRTALEQKLNQNQYIKQYLRVTGRRTLAEASPRDYFWGTGCSLRDKDVTNENAWKGKNNLGKLLTELRGAV